MSPPAATARRYDESNWVPTSTLTVTGAIGDAVATSRTHGPTLHAPKTTPTRVGGSPTSNSVRPPSTVRSSSNSAARSRTGSVTSTLRTAVGSCPRDLPRNDRLVWLVAVRIPLRQPAAFSEADSAGSGQGSDVRGVHPRFDSGQTQRSKRILDYRARRFCHEATAPRGSAQQPGQAGDSHVA